MPALPESWVYSDVDDGTLYFIYSFVDSRLPIPPMLVAEPFQSLVSQIISSADNVSDARRDSYGTELTLHARKQYE